MYCWYYSRYFGDISAYITHKVLHFLKVVVSRNNGGAVTVADAHTLYIRAMEGKSMRIIPLSPCDTIEGDFCEMNLFCSHKA